ncbi:hypothetical protein HD597_000837 [Nonomuraea thailandensis]|uniref:Uncharacterized protein n=1 Tax=Nonomuraea thailandensis TaxID=1188745 RepID=A0A9X2GA00_9ACTN|nr:hypothetical protein [Nonomuraea thailandensis]
MMQHAEQRNFTVAMEARSNPNEGGDMPAHQAVAIEARTQSHGDRRRLS